MKLFERINDTLDQDISTRALIKIVLLFVAVWLFQETSGFWLGLLSRIWSVISPFAIGFVIAYILHGPIRFFEKHGISKKIIVPVLYIVIFLLIFWLIYSLVPLLINRASNLISSLINGVQWISSKISELSNDGMPAWLSSIFSEGVDALTSIKSLLPDWSSNLSGILSSVLSVLLTTVISIVVSIFMCFGWDNIRFQVDRLTRRVSKRLHDCVFAINTEESSYIRSLLILICCHFVEYCLLYFFVGHQDWLIMGILTALSLIVPYLGPTIANIIGIFTGLSLPTGNLIFLIIMILVLSSTDEYVMAPIVHSKNTNVTPLWAIFSVFAGSALFGVVGVIVAIPAFLAIRMIIIMYHGDEVPQQ